MNCYQCGSPISEGSKFCQTCGASVPEPQNTPVQPAQSAPQPQQPPVQQPYGQQSYGQQPQQPPVQPYAQQPYTQQPYGAPQYAPMPQYKKRTKLVVSLIAIGAVLIAAAVCLYIFVLSGTSVVGQWYCEERGQVLVFGDKNTVTGYSLTGSQEATYTYDKNKGAGTLAANDTELTFKVEKNELVLTDESVNDESTFVKVDSKKDTEELVLSALQGLWSSDEIGEVLEFKDGKINVYSPSGNFNGTYDYDIKEGKGSFTVNGTDFNFSADYSNMSVENTGNYVKADDKLDIAAFVGAKAASIEGMWYDTAGTYGTIEFKNDGTAQIVMFDTTIAATYTFDAAAGTGTLTSETAQQPSTFTLKDGSLVIDGITYSQQAVEQMDSGGQTAASLIGTWYETTGQYGDVTLSEDGSVVFSMNNQYYYGTYTFDAASQIGVMNMEVENSTEAWNYTFDGSTLTVGELSYTRDTVTPASTTSGIVGKWYDTTGASGTVTFYEDYSALFDCYGTVLTGTYTFDDATGVGTLTIDDPKDPYYADMTMTADGKLNVDTIQYTRDFVQQADYSGQ